MLNELLISAAFLGGMDFPLDIETMSVGQEPLVQNEESLTSREHLEARLSREERAKIVRSWHLAVNKMNFLMDKSENEAQMIFEVNIRKSTVGLIQGAISGMASKNLYGVAVGACLGGFGAISGDSYVHFLKSRNYVKQAKFYAFIADELQQQLWRG
tara:strand:- start:9544 stop:10014 length:471 start_codon:yes stop_codon:yes gene_type:complete